MPGSSMTQMPGLTTMPDSCCGGLVAKSDQSLESGSQPDPNLLGLTPNMAASSHLGVTPNMAASSHLGVTPNMAARPKQIIKDKEQLCTLIVGREKRKKKCKQSIISGNPTMICLHTPHHVREDTSSHLSRWWMTKFGHQKASHTLF